MTVDEKAEYLLEFYRVGNSVKVSAIDPVTTTEVHIVGPANVGRAELSRVAVRKLKYVLRKAESKKKNS